MALRHAHVFVDDVTGDVSIRPFGDDLDPLASAGVRQSSLAVDAATVAALSAGIDLTPFLGVGHVGILIGGSIHYIPGASAYTGGGTFLVVDWAGTTGDEVAAFAAGAAAPLLTTTAAAIPLMALNPATKFADPASIEGSPLTLRLPTGDSDFATGDGTLLVHVQYVVVPMA